MKKFAMSSFNAAATFAGHIISWHAPVSIFIASVFVSALTGQDIGMIDVVKNLTPMESLQLAGTTAFGLGVATLGYSHALGHNITNPPKKGALAHAMNFAASSVGAITTTLSTAVAADTYNTFGRFPDDPQTIAIAGLGIAIGLATFGVGYGRYFGRNRDAAPVAAQTPAAAPAPQA